MLPGMLKVVSRLGPKGMHACTSCRHWHCLTCMASRHVSHGTSGFARVPAQLPALSQSVCMSKRSNVHMYTSVERPWIAHSSLWLCQPWAACRAGCCTQRRWGLACTRPSPAGLYGPSKRARGLGHSSRARSLGPQLAGSGGRRACRGPSSSSSKPWSEIHADISSAQHELFVAFQACLLGPVPPPPPACTPGRTWREAWPLPNAAAPGLLVPLAAAHSPPPPAGTLQPPATDSGACMRARSDRAGWRALPSAACTISDQPPASTCASSSP